MKNTYSLKAFTLIELMVGIVLTILLMATFFRFFNQVATAEQTNNYKTSALVQGSSSLDLFSNAVNLIGLTTTNAEFIIAEPRVIQETLGTSTGNDNVVFTFNSVFGGPITKIRKDNISGTTPNCHFSIEKTAAFNSTKPGKIRILAKDNFYYTQLDYMNSTWVSTKISFTTENGVTPIFGVPCVNILREGDLVTGPNYFYRLTWVRNGDLRLQRVLQPVPFVFNSTTAFNAGSEELIKIPAAQVPLVILQFMRQDPTTHEELWENGQAYTVDDYRDIKAVRIGIILLPRMGKDFKGASVSGHNQILCPFEDNGCVTIDDLSRPPTMFKKVIYLRNLDYLLRGVTP